MIKSVRIIFDKLIHDTGKAILVRINGNELWIPKKLCRNLIINKKLGGNVCVPTFFLEKLGLSMDQVDIDVEILHHIPEQQTKEIKHDADLFR